MALILTGKWGAVADSFYLKGRLIWSIVLFRVQVAMGTLIGITAMIDPSVFTSLNPKYVAAFVIFNALGAEWLRRRKSKEEDE